MRTKSSVSVVVFVIDDTLPLSRRRHDAALRQDRRLQPQALWRVRARRAQVDFRVKPSFPKSLSHEFLLVDLVNNLDRLAESKKEVLERVRKRAASYDATKLERTARHYGNVRTKKFFADVLKPRMAVHAGRLPP